MPVLPLLPTRSAERMLRQFDRRSHLPLRPNILWQIETGFVRTSTWQEDGTCLTLGLWGSGDIVGKALSKAEPYQIECLTAVEATLLPISHWHQATDALLLHIQRSGELIEILHCKKADSSLLKLLGWLAERFGHQVEQGQLIDLRLTHQDIAELIGLTRVTVTRLLNEFEKQGIIQRVHRQFVVLHDQQPFWHYEI